MKYLDELEKAENTKGRRKEYEKREKTKNKSRKSRKRRCWSGFRQRHSRSN